MHEARRDVSALAHQLRRRRQSHPVGRSHETTDVETAVASELQMPLLDSGSLVAKPCVAPGGESSGQIV
jgi:hypothetical protein